MISTGNEALAFGGEACASDVLRIGFGQTPQLGSAAELERIKGK